MQMVGSIKNFAERYPTSFGYWCMNLPAFALGMQEIVILGPNYKQIANELLKEYVPFKMLQAGDNVSNYWPMLIGKSASAGETKIYVCENYQCHPPVTSLEEFRKLITKNIFNKKST